MYDTRLSGIALEMVDGGVLEGVTVSNILMDGVGAPIFVRWATARGHTRTRDRGPAWGGCATS